ncbi:YHYH domain-containing protein [Candidatus Woesebacteria bacterium]|nr:YHYH domain-containing protein [Candidatus Woesebacteria bacterium]
MKKLIILVLFLAFPSIVSAHSGRTNSSGCHNCNVGSCAGTYHCHGGGSYQAPSTATYKPVATARPVATIRPTVRPTITPTPYVAPIAPVVSQTTKKDDDDWGTIATLGVLGGLGYWGYRSGKNKKK